MNSNNDFGDFLRVTELYKLKKIDRNSSNNYFETKTKTHISRKETVSEHVYSCLKLADYFFSLKLDELKHLNQMKVFKILMYHDDIEAELGDVSISDEKERLSKELVEKENIEKLSEKYPKNLSKQLLDLNEEYRLNYSPEAIFSHFIDKLDALVHELEYKNDRGPKGFTKDNVDKWFKVTFEKEELFMKYYNFIISYLEENGYFNTEKS